MESLSKSKMLDDVNILTLEPIQESKYIKPMRVTYVQAGVKKIWDYMKVHDSVAILLFNVTSQSFVLVQQFRPAVYMASYSERESDSQGTVPPAAGITYELCAGIIDRDSPPRLIAASEVLEETGYKIDPDKLEAITTFRAGIGTSGQIQHLFYAEIDDSMKVTDGGGCPHEGELIDLFYLKLSDVKSFMADPAKAIQTPSGALFAFSWFLNNKWRNH